MAVDRESGVDGDLTRFLESFDSRFFYRKLPLYSVEPSQYKEHGSRVISRTVKICGLGLCYGSYGVLLFLPKSDFGALEIAFVAVFTAVGLVMDYLSISKACKKAEVSLQIDDQGSFALGKATQLVESDKSYSWSSLPCNLVSFSAERYVMSDDGDSRVNSISIKSHYTSVLENCLWASVIVPPVLIRFLSDHVSVGTGIAIWGGLVATAAIAYNISASVDRSYIDVLEDQSKAKDFMDSKFPGAKYIFSSSAVDAIMAR